MHPVLTHLSVGDTQIPIGGYGVMLAFALLAGSLLALRDAVRARLDAGAFIAAIAAAVGSGFAGATALFAAVEWFSSRALPAAPGTVFYGGAIAGGLGFAAMARAHGLPLAAALDALVPALPIAHALGRIGCLLGGCCYGAAWSGAWAITYVDPIAPGAHPSLPRHPWPVYEAVALIALAGVFALARSKRWFARPGTAATAYVLAYALVRFALEPLRGDVVRGVGWLGLFSTSQVVSIALAFGALAVLAKHVLASRRWAV